MNPKVNGLTFEEWLEKTGNFSKTFKLDEFAAWRDGKAPERKMNSQQSLNQQLRELLKIANSAGLYDAADWLVNSNPSIVKDDLDNHNV